MKNLLNSDFIKAMVESRAMMKPNRITIKKISKIIHLSALLKTILLKNS